MAPNFFLNGPRSRDDRAMIARRSRFFVLLDQPSDEDLMVAHDRASDEDQTLWKPPHVASDVPKS